MRKARKRVLSALLAAVLALGLMPSFAFAGEGDVPASSDRTPTASDYCFFANGTPITITETAPKDGTKETFGDFTAEGTDAYISWDEDGVTKYVGVNANEITAKKAYVFGGADGRQNAVSVESTSITMTGGTIHRLFGGNFGEEEASTDFCSTVTGDVYISLSEGAVVKDLLHGAGARNTCVNGTVTMEFDSVNLSNSSNALYVNGGSWGNGKEGTRDIENGTMETDAVANKVIITAKNSGFHLLGGGGSGSTKVLSSSVTLKDCWLTNLYLGGINGEVAESSIVATNCTIGNISATNRGFVGKGSVDLNGCTITKLNTGAANGCFSSDSGGTDGSGVTGSCVWDIDAGTTVEDAQLTPLVMKDNGSYTNTYENLTVQKAGKTLELEITNFVADVNNDDLTQHTFAVPEGSTLTLKGVQATVVANSTLTNAGAIDMDESSSLAVASGATFNQMGAIEDDKVVDNGGTIKEDYAARIGTTGYDTLQEAINVAGSGATVTLLKNVDENTITLDADKDITLDLGGHDLTLSQFDLVRGQLTVENGNVECAGQAFNVYAGPTATTATDELYTKLVIEKDVTVNAAYGICLFPAPNSKAGYSSAIEVHGKIESGGIFVSGNLGNDKTSADAMAGSGKIPTVTIYKGAVVSNDTEGQGIAMNGLANVTVNGGTISGGEAIGVKRGTLTVNGGTFTSNGEHADPAEANNNGTEDTGATISITGTYNYAGTISVTLNGGTFTSDNSPAVYLGHSKKNGALVPYTNGVTLNIQGGTFTSKKAEVTPVFVADKVDAETYSKQVISGGTFSQDLSDKGYLTDEVKYEVAHGVGTFSYATSLTNAQELAQPGDDITYLKGTEGNTVTLILNYNDGSATANSMFTVESDAEIILPKPTRDGYTFKGWSDGANTYDAGDSYKVTGGATLTAVWSANATPVPTPEQFDVAVADVQNGAVELSAKTAKEGQKVTVTVTPDLGWELAQLTVADEDGDALELTENADGTYSFTMPAGDVTVHASFADAWENPFTDLSEDHWGYGAVRTANLLGLMKGIGGTTLFGPDDGLLREQAATVMWNLMGAGDVSRPEAPQADVDQSQWYAPYVNWAVDSKVMDGYSEDDFGVGDSLTREQFAAVVAKAVGADVDSADQAALGAFPDADGVSGWARATMAWAVEAGVLNGVGTEDGSRELQATRELTRAEMATMMVNAIEVGVLDFGA